MVLINAIKWLASKRLIALVYAEDEKSLGTEIGDLTICPGSKAYTGEGKSYVLNLTEWVEVVSGGTEELPSSDNEEF